jgi:hypothetical protein
MGGYGIVGQAINVPVDMNNMVMTIPRQLNDDYSFNVHFKRNLIHKRKHLQGCIKKATVQRWLERSVQTPLYKSYNTEIDPTSLKWITCPKIHMN